MLNPFYWYSAAWTAQLVLYMLGWSDRLAPLNNTIKAIIVLTVIVSALIGFIFRKEFKTFPLEENPHKKAWPTVVLIILFSLNFFYAGWTPLTNIFMGLPSNYSSFPGIPTFAPFIYTLTAYYCVYLIFVFARFPSFRMGLEIAGCALMFLFTFSRSYLMVFAAALIVSLTDRMIKKGIKRFAAFAILGVVAVYLYGGLGNLRGGYGWNDNSGIFAFALINDKWPSWLPGQFAWGYDYLTSPLNNLRYNIDCSEFSKSIPLFVCCFLPDFISKRVSPNYLNNGILADNGHTVSGAFTPAYNYGGYAGIVVMFVLLVLAILLIVFLNRIVKRNDLKNTNIMIAIYFMALSFFMNPFYYPGSFMMMFFAVAFSLISILIDRKKKE